MRKLNCEEARKLSIVNYLEKCGFSPQYIRGNNHWYLSPMRDEKHASFKVDSQKNLWFDHGTGEGGNFVDLGIRLHRCSVDQLLARLSAADNSLPFQPPLTGSVNAAAAEPDMQRIKILDVSPLNDSDLTAYITGRGIDLTTARWYCREITFSMNDKTYTAVGFENRSGGYELRNSWFKGSSSPKDITLLSSHDNARAVCVIEGFVDFLSLQALRQMPDEPVDIIVLNSVSLIGRSIDLLSNYGQVYQYLNHDKAGYAAAEKLKEAGIKTVDASGFYQGYNDINAYLMAVKRHSLNQEIKPKSDERQRHGLRR